MSVFKLKCSQLVVSFMPLDCSHAQSPGFKCAAAAAACFDLKTRTSGSGLELALDVQLTDNSSG